MKITQERAEHKLFEQIEDLKENAPTHRCAVFRLSQIPLLPEGAHEKIMQTAAKVIEDKGLHFFICGDGDLFMLSRHITNKFFVLVLSHPTISPWLVSPKGEPAHLFEVGVDGDVIQILLQPKIDIIEHRSEEAKKKEKNVEIMLLEKAKEQALNPDIRIDMIANLPDRRNDRSESYILIVEDDPFTRRLVEKSLGARFRIFIAENAAQAIQSYIRHAPDVLFLDIGLPDADGLHVLDKVMEIDKDAYTVMLSGNGHKENVIKAVEKGAKGFVGKPFTKGKLEDYISKSPFIKKKAEEAQ